MQSERLVDERNFAKEGSRKRVEQKLRCGKITEDWILFTTATLLRMRAKIKKRTSAVFIVKF